MFIEVVRKMPLARLSGCRCEAEGRSNLVDHARRGDCFAALAMTTRPFYGWLLIILLASLPCSVGLSESADERSTRFDFDGEVVSGIRLPLDSLSQVTDREKQAESERPKPFEKEAHFSDETQEVVREIAEEF